MPSLCAKINSKKNGSNFFEFPGEERLRKKWSAFCRRDDKEFTSIKNLHVCSEHFETKQIVKTLSGIKKLAHGAVPTIINQHIVRRTPSQREKRSSERKKRDASEDIKEVLPAKNLLVSTVIALKDHDYTLKENKVHREEAFKEKDYVTVSCQTNINLQQMDDMIKKFIDVKS